MALDPSDRYPGQVDVSDLVGYPYGAAQNIVVEGDGIGTPLEKDLVSDLFGMQQALLDAADIEPSGVPDKVGASQYLEAIRAIGFRSRNFVNVQESAFGAIGNGGHDDLAAINAAIAYVAAAGGGAVYFPPGRYRITGVIVRSPLVRLVGIPGLSVIAIDDASASVYSFTTGTYDVPVVDFGIYLEADQANSGTVFFTDTISPKLEFVRCGVNVDAQLLQGALVAGDEFETFKFVKCDLTTATTGEAFASDFGTIEFEGGTCVMAPDAAADMARADILRANGTSFSQVSTVGNVAFLNPAGTTARVFECRGCAFNVDDSGAGFGTYAMRVQANANMQTSGNIFVNDAIPYSRVGLAAAGSVLQLLPALRLETAAGADVALIDGYESFIVEAAKVTAPDVTPPDPLFPGQRMSCILRNVSGGTWAGNPTTVDVLDSTTGLSGLVDDGYITYSWVALDINGDDTAVWTQSAAPGVI